VPSSRNLTILSLAQLKREELKLVRAIGLSVEEQSGRLQAIRVEIEIRRDEIKAEKRAMQQRALDLKEREVALEERRLDEMVKGREQMAALSEKLGDALGVDDDDDAPPFPPFFSNRVGRG
jgi:hypothetical protein